MSGKMIEKMARSQKIEHHIDQKVRSPKIENRTEKARSSYYFRVATFQDNLTLDDVIRDKIRITNRDILHKNGATGDRFSQTFQHE